VTGTTFRRGPRRSGSALELGKKETVLPEIDTVGKRRVVAVSGGNTAAPVAREAVASR
jgi:hypothetical protein